MEKLIGKAWSALALGVTVVHLGCASTERDVAKTLDMTPEIIQHSTDLIAADPELGRFPIVVDGFKGKMEIKGQVATQAQKERVEKIVWTSKGVKSVENYLQAVAPPGGR